MAASITPRGRGSRPKRRGLSTKDQPAARAGGPPTGEPSAPWHAGAVDCPICVTPVPPGARGQARIYCSPACRKQAELDVRRRRKLEAFEAAMVGGVANREEVLALLTAAARTGSVLAAKPLL